MYLRRASRPRSSKALGPPPKPYLIKAGAVQMATLIVGEIEKQGGLLATYLK